MNLRVYEVEGRGEERRYRGSHETAILHETDEVVRQRSRILPLDAIGTTSD